MIFRKRQRVSPSLGPRRAESRLTAGTLTGQPATRNARKSVRHELGREARLATETLFFRN